ncbi:hypothetical protein B0A48_03520 [Cryoendolithus antarcticus]|uniref:Calcineurin-like phosphoesterase domain-containing protein n=1 Tax=Cryoendolithus antarcticus TaxID=1507870 RepID=A0A1V8TK82_9PEZI|nr:hypothetical protein B0A48_03520 [Cryoendolithus antarcticus]
MASHTSTTNNVHTSFLIISDTHNFEAATAEEGCPLAQKMPRVDVLLHCGDLTQVGGLSAYKKALKLLASIDAELKLVIAGNHDLSLDGEYWATHLDEDDDPNEHDEAIEIMTGKLAKEAGVTYLMEGTHHFTLSNGAAFSLFASPFQPECGEWAFGYPRNVDHFVSKAPGNVDIMMTHGPPAGILDLVPGKNERIGCNSLLKAVEKARPKLHCFGHIHEGYGYEVKTWSEQGRNEVEEIETSVRKAGVEDAGEERRLLRVGRETLMVNAAIMDDSNQAVNAPWVVEMELPRKA